MYAKPYVLTKLGLAYLYEMVVQLFGFLQHIRQVALETVMAHIKQEDLSTNFICLGPVNKVLNMLAVYVHEGNSLHLKNHEKRMYDYIWVAHDGAKVQGYNGSQLWDTAFACQAIITAGLNSSFMEHLDNAQEYIIGAQIVQRSHDNYFRHNSRGGWPFSTREQAWIVSDCTAEALKAVLMYQELPYVLCDVKHLFRHKKHALSEELISASVSLLLSLQNASGGWASYEKTRNIQFTELLNPSSVFKSIMIDYSYVECTSACIQALKQYQSTSLVTTLENEQISKAISKGLSFLKQEQNKEGGFYGSWGICYCYGTWFGIAGLIAAGTPVSAPEVRQACKFLKKYQNKDGGWGESYEACISHHYVTNESQIVNTCWALLGLMIAKEPDVKCVEAGVKFLQGKQLENGDFPHDAVYGIFNQTCKITCANYKNIFPIWCLGMFCNEYIQ